MEDPQRELQTEFWWVVAISTVMLMLCVHSLLLAVQASRETGGFGHVSGLEKLPTAIFFGTLGVVPLVSMLLRRNDASPLCSWVATVLLLLFGAATLCGLAAWGSM